MSQMTDEEHRAIYAQIQLRRALDLLVRVREVFPRAVSEGEWNVVFNTLQHAGDTLERVYSEEER